MCGVAMNGLIADPLEEKFGKNLAHGIMAGFGGVLGAGYLAWLYKLQMDKGRLRFKVGALEMDRSGLQHQVNQFKKERDDFEAEAKNLKTEAESWQKKFQAKFPHQEEDFQQDELIGGSKNRKESDI